MKENINTQQKSFFLKALSTYEKFYHIFDYSFIQ